MSVQPMSTDLSLVATVSNSLNLFHSIILRLCSSPFPCPPTDVFFFFFLIIRRPPKSPFFPYTPLSRSTPHCRVSTTLKSPSRLCPRRCPFTPCCAQHSACFRSAN